MSDKTILITRPKGDEAALAEGLHARGYRVIHEPLMEIFLRHTERQALHSALLDDPDAVIVTSRNAVQALALLSDVRDPMLLCVGDATAQAAESMGFNRIQSTGGNAQKLIEYILAAYDEDTRFLYVSGDHVTTDIDGTLKTHGMQTQRIVVYETIAAQSLSDTLIEQLKRNTIDGVTLLSQRTSQIFLNLLNRAGIAAEAEKMEAFALSDTVAKPLLDAGWNGVHVADEATLASMLDCVDNVYLPTHR